jgi:hypothetical protein
VPFDELAEAQQFIQLPHQQQAAVRSHSRALEVDLRPAIERELKLPIFVSHAPPLHLRTAPVASNPAPIKDFKEFYQIGSPPENGNPGLNLVADIEDIKQMLVRAELRRLFEIDCHRRQSAGNNLHEVEAHLSAVDILSERAANYCRFAMGNGGVFGVHIIVR